MYRRGVLTYGLHAVPVFLGDDKPLPQAVGELLHIATPLTTYVARHSWATIAKNEGVPVSIISEGLGHTSEKTTRIYLDSFTNDTMNRVNENVAAAVNDCMKKEGESFHLSI